MKTQKRDYTQCPDVGDAGQFASLMRDWYIELQPADRLQDNPSGEDWPLARPKVVQGMDWGGMRRYGRNGITQILLCVTWWGHSVRTEIERKEWDDFVEDLVWVVTSMVETFEGIPDELLKKEGKKRKTVEGDEKPASKKYVVGYALFPFRLLTCTRAKKA